MTRRRRAQPEQALQKAIVAHLKARGARDLFWFAIPMGGYRSPIEAAIMRSTGSIRGIPDLCFIHEGRAYFLELKTETGKASEPQLAAISAINQAGGFASIAHGLDGALRMLEQWGVLRGSTS
jgi:hypothetical protein